MSSNCLRIGVMSETPVILPPGCSFELTKPTCSGSVMAPRIIGVSFVALAKAKADGVAIAIIKSAPFDVKRLAMVLRLL